MIPKIPCWKTFDIYSLPRLFPISFVKGGVYTVKRWKHRRLNRRPVIFPSPKNRARNWSTGFSLVHGIHIHIYICIRFRNTRSLCSTLSVGSPRRGCASLKFPWRRRRAALPVYTDTGGTSMQKLRRVEIKEGEIRLVRHFKYEVRWWPRVEDECDWSGQVDLTGARLPVVLTPLLLSPPPASANPAPTRSRVVERGRGGGE